MSFAYHASAVENLLTVPAEYFSPERIARVLSRTHRFLAVTYEPWSVADHSVCVAERLEATGDILMCRWGLMHDAAEILLGDVPTPIKRNMFYRDPSDGTMHNLIEVEERLLSKVAERYGLPCPMPACVAEADGRQLASEIQYFFAEPNAGQYAGGFVPWADTALAWPPSTWRYNDSHPRAAERRWMECYRELFKRR